MKRKNWISRALVLLFLIIGTNIAEKESVELGAGTSQIEQVVVDRLPNLPESYDSHLLLQSKGYGACNTMTGKVAITMIMVEDDKSVWDTAALESYKQQQEAATAKLLKEAADYGATLEVEIHYITCRTTGTVSISNYSDWVNFALAAAKLPAQNEVIPYFKDLYNAKEAPVFFCVNYSGRSFGIDWNRGDFFEYGVLFAEAADYRHELNHLFGAIDFYYPAEVVALSDQYLPNSIMSGGDVQVTDSLTAYLIGWTDQVSVQAKAFIDGTAGLTQEYLDEQHQLQILTGTGTIRWGDGTYTGDLVDGYPNGQGKILWDNGNTYEGQWKDGAGHGYGIFFWSTENCTYAGEWVAWQMHGYGTYTYSDGTVVTGRWENGNYIGG